VTAVRTAPDLLADELQVRGAHRSGRTRAVVVSVILAAIGSIAFCWSVSVGEFPIPMSDVVPALLGGGSRDAAFIIHELRLPRALAAVLVGIAFGLSGAIFQSLARNPLASPDIIGITAGASTSAVFIIVVLHGGGAFLSLGAIGGGLVTALAIYLLAFRRGVSAYRLVLVGIGVGAMLNALTSYLLTRAEIHDAQRAAVWLTGSLNGRSWDHVEPLALALFLLVPATLILTRPLRTLQLGDDTARGLGVRVETTRTALVLVGVALAAVATAAAGPVAFVAFVAAPIARRLVDTSLTVVPAALTGATLLLLLADVAARTVFFPTELPVGVVTGLIGAPYLIWLLARSNRIGQGG
jgi:iron complex transport system permease protein